MTKPCSLCNAENRDEAQFCRACGSAFAAVSGQASFGSEPSADNICSECGFRNKPAIRYCANCGMSLAGLSDEAPLADLAPGGDPYAGLSPPPISYASFATVAPYPPAPAAPPGYPPTLDDTTPLDLPDPDATFAIRKQEAQDAPPDFMQASATPAPNRAKVAVAVVVAGLLVAAIAAWLFLGKESSAPPARPAASAPVAAPPPVAPSPAPIIVEPPAPAPASAAAVESTPVVPPAPATAPAIDTPPPAAAAPLPQVTDAVPVEPADAEAKRIAAEKQRRDKAARDKADRDAKAKALADQRDQAAAAARAEQDAQARKRTEEAQRARPAPAPAPAAVPASTQARGVRESCAGRGTIAEAVCQSRLCSAAEHANEPICRQIREADERRRNLLN